MKERIIQALKNAYICNESLDESKRERAKGDKLDVVTQGDLKIGQVIINSFLEDETKKITVESEEYGKQRNYDDGQEDYYIAIDDIDGSNNLRVGEGLLPYCSMIVVFNKENGKEEYSFSDYAYAACLEHTSGRIFYTEKGLGCVEEYDINGNRVKNSRENEQDNQNLALTLSTDVVSSTRGGKTGYQKQDSNDISVLPSVLDGVYKKYAIVDSGCSVFEYAMTGMGIRNGYVSNGKKMHELPLLYAFCKENGAEMCDFEGNSYDDIVYEFEGGDAEVVAGNNQVVNDVCSLIRKQKTVNQKLGELIQQSRRGNDKILDDMEYEI